MQNFRDEPLYQRIFYQCSGWAIHSCTQKHRIRLEGATLGSPGPMSLLRKGHPRAERAQDCVQTGLEYFQWRETPQPHLHSKEVIPHIQNFLSISFSPLPLVLLLGTSEKGLAVFLCTYVKKILLLLNKENGVWPLLKAGAKKACGVMSLLCFGGI